MDSNTKKQLVRIANRLVSDEVKKKSDYWIATTNPFDPKFNWDSDFIDSFSEVMFWFILETRPDISYDDISGVIKSAYLNAMQKEKVCRMKNNEWTPYGKESSQETK